MKEIKEPGNTRKSVLAALWQGAVLMLVLLIVFVSIYAIVYSTSWGRNPHWIEAFRDRYKLVDLAENIRWPWIHQDTQYWIVRLRFDEGPVILEGKPPDARYWSVTYYARQEENPSIHMQNVQFEEDGRYRIVFTQDTREEASNVILVAPDVRRGVIELRITLQEVDAPVFLPSVWQNDTLLAEGNEQ